MDDLEQNQLRKISINHKGDEVIAVVTLAEANILMNDEAAAAKYVEAILAQQGLLKHQTSDCESRVEECSETKHDNFNTKQATLLFLRLRTRYNDKFNDRKTLKISLWQKISTEMRSNGFDIPEGREGAEKCPQKFANLQRSYMNYMKNMKITGTGRRDPPPYFEEMNAILGSKDKVNLPYLEDSLEISIDPEDEPPASCLSTFRQGQIDIRSVDTENESGASCNLSTSIHREIKNRFRSSKTSVRPTSNVTKVLEVITQQHQEVREEKAKYMKILENAINVQNEQRERLLQLLQRADKRKRRRSSGSSDD